jgi:hypothetical protein
MSVAIKYSNPKRPGDVGIVLVSDPSLVAETKESLKRRGFVIENDKAEFQLGLI